MENKESYLSKIDRILRKATLISGAVFSLPMAISVVNVADAILSKRITSQAQLEATVDKERDKLGIQDYVKIDSNLVYSPNSISSDNGTAVSRKIGKNHYEIDIPFNPIMGRESSVEHELYHISDGHLDRVVESPTIGKLKYLLQDEPRATIYAATGI